MSRKLPVRTLGEIALAEVAGSIVGAIGSMLQTTYNFGVEPDFTFLIVEIKSYMETMGATSAIYEDLLRVILCSDSLEAVIRFCCLQTLLNEAVHTLMTEIFPYTYYERILQVIAAQGRGLRQLNMKGVWVKEEYMCFMYEIIKHLPQLTKLTIPHIANDNLLKHISDYCKNLRHLDISGDTDITDIGLEYLSYGESRYNLTVLDIGSLGEENVCHTDIAMLLMNLPNLVSLVSYSFVGRSLQYILDNKDPAFRCKLVYLHDTGTKAKAMDAIIDTCPNLQDLYIDSPETNTLVKLSKVNLRRLKLYKFNCSELLTLLESIGNFTRHLTVIKGRGTMEIHRLIRCCPNLIDLDFYMMDSLSFSGDHGFLDLQGLEILSSPISQPGLRNLLSLSTTLKRLAIDSVTFTDEDFSTLMIEKDFYHLEDVWFTTAPNLSMASVEILMDRCPELQSLGQLSGWSLTPDDVTLLRGILKSCNSSLFDFMRRYGYLEKGPSQAEALYSEEAVVMAIKSIQRYGALPETGVLDPRTIRLMSSPRCGVVDQMPHEQSMRHRRYVIGSESWRKRKITYFIANWSSKVGEDSVAKFMQRAFNEWAKYSNLKFVRVYDPSADIIVGFGSGHHGDNYPFDGPGNILAHAFYPYEMQSYGGDIHFDEDENWKENSTHLSDGVDFYSVAIHELGHSLGLAHSPVYSSLMFPYYKGITQGTLDYDDILAVYKLYIQNPYITDEPYNYPTEETVIEEEYDEPSSPATTPEPVPRLPDFVTEPLNPSDFPTTPVPPYDIPITYVGDYTTVDDHLTRHQYEGVTQPELPEFTQMPNVCSGGFDAVGVLRGEVFIFKGPYLWRLTEKYRIRDGYPVRIWQVFRGFPRDVQRIDAVYEREFDNGVVLFSGKSYWIFDGLNFLHPEARPITDFGLPNTLEKVDAAMVWSKNQKTYLFAGDQFWRFNDTTGTLDEDYPRSMDRWYGIPTNLDAATSVASGKTYFFKGNYYWLYNNERVRPERGYPRKASNVWLGCRVA